MKLDANDLLLFARVVEAGSFSRAGEGLGLPKATVSRRVSALETQLGERLLLRTTRKLSLTDFGQHVLAHAQQVADEVAGAASLAQHRQATPQGRLRVSMPGDIATGVLSRLLAGFVQRYPAISLELDLSPRRVDLIGEAFDLAVRMGELGEDASLAARKLADFAAGLYAAPGYLARAGTPSHAADLLHHHGLVMLNRQGEPRPWQLEREGDTWHGLPPVRTVANSPEMLTRLARDGVGIAIVLHHFAQDHVARGELVPVLSDWSLPRTPAWAVFPGRRLMPARTRVFLDALAAEFAGPACQARTAGLDAT